MVNTKYCRKLLIVIKLYPKKRKGGQLMEKTVKKYRVLTIALCFAFGLTCCKNQSGADSDGEIIFGGERREYFAETYEEKTLPIMGFWAPDVDEESYKLYKECGFNTVLLINNSSEKQIKNGKFVRDTTNTYYLGSEYTALALAMSRKFEMKAVLSLNDWLSDYSGSATPFTTRTTYEDYRDMIIGVHISDEPYKQQIDYYSRESFIDDYKKAYGDLPYMLNLHPELTMSTAPQLNFGMGKDASYNDYVTYFCNNIVSKFNKNRYISVDLYPCTQRSATNKFLKSGWLHCYETIANNALKYNCEYINYYIQAVEGEATDVRLPSEADIRLQVNMALAYGANQISYYTYNMPHDVDELGRIVAMYEKCILDNDGKPTVLYDAAKKVNAELAAFDDAYLAYKYCGTYPIFAKKNTKTDFAYLENRLDLSTLKRVSDITADNETVVGLFGRDDGEQAFMLVNYSETTKNVTANVTVNLKDSEAVAVYGGIGFDGTPQIIYAENGKVHIRLLSGEGKFFVPLKK